MNFTSLIIQFDPVLKSASALSPIFGILFIVYIFYRMTVFFKIWIDAVLGNMCSLKICTMDFSSIIQYGIIFFVLVVLGGAYFISNEFTFTSSFEIVVISLGLFLAVGSFVNPLLKHRNLKNELDTKYHPGDVHGFAFEKIPRILAFVLIEDSLSFWWRPGYKAAFRIPLSKLATFGSQLLSKGDPGWVIPPIWLTGNGRIPKGFLGIRKIGTLRRGGIIRINHVTHARVDHS